MTKILLPVDGSPNALRAARKVVEMASLWKEAPRIVPLYVHLPLPRAGLVSRVVGRSVVRRYYREDGEQAVMATLKVLKKAGYPLMPAFHVGPIAETIVNFARRNKFDLICIGSRGMTATANLLLGSVATKVLHLAEVPVLMIR
mgnify:CR=1 FL=1